MTQQPLHIMAIGAHAADMEITAGAVILKHTHQGHRATLVHLTLGGRGHAALSEEEYTARKLAEAQAAAQALGADVRILPYRDGELVATEEAKFAVADLIRELRPSHLITHWPGSIHKDHRATFEIVRDAIFYAALPGIKRQYPAHEVIGPFLTENWEDNIGYTPQIYCDVSSVFEAWQQAIQCYSLFRGQVSDFDYVSYYCALATLRGSEAGFLRAVTLATEHSLAVYMSEGLDQPLSLFTSASPIFRPQRKAGTVG